MSPRTSQLERPATERKARRTLIEVGRISSAWQADPEDALRRINEIVTTALIRSVGPS